VINSVRNEINLSIILTNFYIHFHFILAERSVMISPCRGFRFIYTLYVTHYVYSLKKLLVRRFYSINNSLASATKIETRYKRFLSRFILSTRHSRCYRN